MFAVGKVFLELFVCLPGPRIFGIFMRVLKRQFCGGVPVVLLIIIITVLGQSLRCREYTALDLDVYWSQKGGSRASLCFVSQVWDVYLER